MHTDQLGLNSTVYQRFGNLNALHDQRWKYWHIDQQPGNISAIPVDQSSCSTDNLSSYRQPLVIETSILNMVVKCGPFDTINNQNCNKSNPTSYTEDPQNSPLDLSVNKPSPFAQRSMSIDESPSTPVGTTDEVNAYMDRQMSVECQCDAPKILTEPKSDWHYRSVKDLEKSHIPFLSGVGPQRTPLRIIVPKTSTEQMYLVVSVVTYNKKPHLSKVIVPSKTRVIVKQPLRNNNLDCLNFDECDQMEYFDRISRNVYLPISEEEHASGLKEVRVHMFNLYQNEIITKDVIETYQLQQCRLAFWFCIRQYGQEILISRSTYSNIIQEKKHATGLRVSQNNNINNGLSDSCSMVSDNYIRYDSPSDEAESN